MQFPRIKLSLSWTPWPIKYNFWRKFTSLSGRLLGDVISHFHKYLILVELCNAPWKDVTRLFVSSSCEKVSVWGCSVATLKGKGEGVHCVLGLCPVLCGCCVIVDYSYRCFLCVCLSARFMRMYVCLCVYTNVCTVHTYVCTFYMSVCLYEYTYMYGW